MKTPPKNTQRAYAVTSFILASLRGMEYDSGEVKKLHMQCARAMRSFSAQVDTDWFAIFISSIGDIWEYAGRKNDSLITQESVGALVEVLGYILPPAEFKEFLGIPAYHVEGVECNVRFKDISEIVLIINEELNKLLGTKSAVLQKPKQKKVKIKKEREKSKKQKKHEEEMLKIAEAKERKKARLQEIVKAAKERKIET